MPDPSTIERPLTRRRAKLSVLLYAVFLLLMAAGWALAVFGPESEYGDSLRNLGQYALLGILVAGSLVWVVLFAPLPKGGRLLFAATFVLPILVWFACVKTVRVTGDMVMHPVYRWETSAAERRAAAPIPQPFTEAEVYPVATEFDYASYRGPNRDGVLPDTEIDFTKPPKEVWSRDVGGGFAGMAVVEDYLVTIEMIGVVREPKPDEPQEDLDPKEMGVSEMVVAYDTADGRERWRYTVPGSFVATTGSGPRSTPTIDDGDVFALTSLGTLLKLDVLTGKLAWEYDGRGDSPNVTWGTSASPLLDGDQVVVNFGTPKGGGLTAVDRQTGEELWRHEPTAPLPSDAPQVGRKDRNAAGYGSPMVATFEGVRQYILFDGDGVGGYDPETGQQLWFDRFANEYLINVAQPLVFDDGRVFVCSSYGLGGRMLQVSRDADAWSVNEVWADRRVMRCKFTSPVAHKGYIYGLSEGVLECVDAETGKRMWKDRGGNYRHGQVLLVGDVLVVQAEDGRLATVRATPDGFKELMSVPVLDDPKSWNPLSLSRDRLFMRDPGRMVRLDFADP